MCGITNREDAQAAIELGADALGFVFAKSPRQVTKEQAGDIIKKLPPFVSFVGVFVDERVETIREVCDFCHIGTVQLHGNEPPTCLHYLEGYKIIKAFRVKEEGDLRQLGDYQPHAFLLDSYVKGVMGGTGVPFQWDIAAAAHKYGAIILSGGLTPDNVVAAIRTVKPYAVDVSSGVESSPGKKDKRLMERFMESAKGSGL